MSAVIVPPVGPLVRCAHVCGEGTRDALVWLLLAGIGVGVAGLGGLLVVRVWDTVRAWRRR